MTLNLPNTLFSVIFLAVSIAYLTVIAVHGDTRSPTTAQTDHDPQIVAKQFPPHQRTAIVAGNSNADSKALRAARETARQYAAKSEDFQSLSAPSAKMKSTAKKGAVNDNAIVTPRPKPGALAIHSTDTPSENTASDDPHWENNAVASINPAPERITSPHTAPPTDRNTNTQTPRQTWIWKLAHQDYCERNPSDCGRFEPAPLIDWQENETLIDQTWRTVYESFWPTEDVGGDTWGIGQDCEDYALKLRSELARAGIPRYHLLMATGRALESSQKLHAVLIIRTDDGWKIADSLHANILDKPSADRTFDCQYMEDPDRGVWASCNDTGSPVYAGF